MEEMVGSYGPSAGKTDFLTILTFSSPLSLTHLDLYTKKFPIEEAPQGMLARGTYKVKSRFVDDDNHCHLEWSWTFEIKKDW